MFTGKRISGIVFAVVCSALLVAGTSAQSIFGGIEGTVKDPGQGAIGAAQVMLTNSDDGTTHTSTTDSDGGFEFVNLKPGHYEIAILAPGFSEFKLSHILLEVRQTYRADVGLKLAANAQTIEVSGDAGPALNTEDATIGDSKDFQQIKRWRPSEFLTWLRSSESGIAVRTGGIGKRRWPGARPAAIL